jgi:cation-transporting P-type ATPase D
VVGAICACYVTGGWPSAGEGILALRSRTLDVDLLVVAAIGAATIGQIFYGALLIVIFAISGALEGAATKRTEDSLKGLLTLAPDRATRIDADGNELRRATVGVAVVDGQPGCRFGLDDTLRDGAAELLRAITEITLAPPVLITGDNHRGARRVSS